MRAAAQATTNPMMDSAIGYANQGWPVFPCSPSTKQPYTPKGFKDATKDVNRIADWWKQHPNAMIGVPTGAASGFWALDIDVKPEANGAMALAKLEELNGGLPITMTASTPSGGTHHYFKYETIVKNRTGVQPGIDVRGEGGYVIAPGSVRDDGCYYEWKSDAKELAAAPPWLLALIIKPPTTSRQAKTGGSNPAYSEAAITSELQKLMGTTTNRNAQLNDSAFAIGQFVGAREISRRDAVDRLFGAATANGYVGKDGPAAARATIKSGLDAGEKKPRDIPEFGYLPDADPEFIAELIENMKAANDNEPAKPSFASDAVLSDLTDPGGLVGDIVDWVVSSSSRPSRELALAATLPFVGALIGRRFATPTDLRTNIYSVGLASSGYGKDQARTQLKRLITAAGLDKFAGPGRFMSATALRVTVMAKPSCFCMIDEFGGMMRQINDRKAGIHNLLIRSDLLEMFSSAATYFEGAAYAATSAAKLHNPNLCLYGTSTPEDFWASVSSLNTTDGLLPRFMLFNVTGAKPPRVVPENPVYVPPSLIDQCQALALAGRGTGNLSNKDNGNQPTKPIVVPYSDEAASELARFEQFIEEKELAVGAESAPVLNRAVEHAIKLALTVSVADNWDSPVITGHAMKWAVQLAWLSTSTMIEETRDRISDNAREADLKRILGHIKRVGSDGITEGQVADRCGSIDRNRRLELISDLILAGRIREVTTRTKGRPKRRYYLV